MSENPKDPFNLQENESSDDCFQSWAKEKTYSKYPSLNVDTKKKEVKCYPSPKEKKSFIERMRERDAKQDRVRFTPKTVRKLFQSKKGKKNSKKEDPIESLTASPRMKTFIRQEFEREKVKYNFLPERQVKLQVIHRFKTHIKNSEEKNVTPKKKFKKSPKIGQSKSGRKGKKERHQSGDSGFNEGKGSDEEEDGEDYIEIVNEKQSGSSGHSRRVVKRRQSGERGKASDDDDDVDIEEYDDRDMAIPKPGSFQICPSKRQRASSKNVVLVCYHPDSDTDTIVDSSQDLPELVEEAKKLKSDPSPTKFKFFRDLTPHGEHSPSPSPVKKSLARTPLPYSPSPSPVKKSKGRTSLPYLLTISPDPDTRPILANTPDEPEEDDERMTRYFRQEICSSCLAPSASLQTCSKCEMVVYCNIDCQADNWTFHRTRCNKLKAEGAETREAAMKDHWKHANKRSAKSTVKGKTSNKRMSKGKRSSPRGTPAKSVKFLSQPEYEPSEGSPVKKAFPKTPVKSILKKTPVKKGRVFKVSVVDQLSSTENSENVSKERLDDETDETENNKEVEIDEQENDEAAVDEREEVGVVADMVEKTEDVEDSPLKIQNGDAGYEMNTIEDILKVIPDTPDDAPTLEDIMEVVENENRLNESMDMNKSSQRLYAYNPADMFSGSDHSFSDSPRSGSPPSSASRSDMSATPENSPTTASQVRRDSLVRRGSAGGRSLPRSGRIHPKIVGAGNMGEEFERVSLDAEKDTGGEMERQFGGTPRKLFFGSTELFSGGEDNGELGTPIEEDREVDGKGSNQEVGTSKGPGESQAKQLEGEVVEDIDEVYEDFSSSDVKSQDHVLQSRPDVLSGDVAAINDEALACSFSSSWSPSQGDFQKLESYFSGFEEEMKKQIVEEEETRKRGQDENLRNDENGPKSTKNDPCSTSEKVVNDIFSPMMFSSDEATSSGTQPKDVSTKEAQYTETCGREEYGPSDDILEESGNHLDDSTADMFEQSQEPLCDMFSDPEEEIPASGTSDDSGKLFGK